MPDRVQVIDPLAALGGGDQPFPFDLFERSCLAQGDSWFSLGALPPTRTTRVVAELRPKRSTVVVNCAKPGALLHRMTNTTTEPLFLRLLNGKVARRWNAILLSGGGNDLIEAVGTAPDHPADQRLLKTPAERGPAPAGGAAYLSEPGWKVFADHIETVFNKVVDARDAGVNKGVPLVWHNYARVMPRPSGAGLGFGPWLLPALDLYQVPPGDRLAVSDELIGRLAKMIQAIVARRMAKDPAAALHVADSQNAGIVLSAPDSTDESGDWINEIHLTKAGYAKAAAAWTAILDPLFG